MSAWKMSIGHIQISVGHAPILADAHRCASDAHTSHKPHQIVKKNQLFLTKILWFSTLIFHSWGWIKPSLMNNNDILAPKNAKYVDNVDFHPHLHPHILHMRIIRIFRIFRIFRIRMANPSCNTNCERVLLDKELRVIIPCLEVIYWARLFQQNGQINQIGEIYVRAWRLILPASRWLKHRFGKWLILVSMYILCL